jgi:uncharacterized protein YajQ (UPF0234 family)
LEIGKPETGPKGTSKLLAKIKDGIPVEKAREIIKIIKDQKLKVQAGIHEDQVRVAGKSRDDLQSCIQLLRQQDFGIELQFINFRD